MITTGPLAGVNLEQMGESAMNKSDTNQRDILGIGLENSARDALKRFQVR
jgi:hypothetical protein